MAVVDVEEENAPGQPGFVVLRWDGFELLAHEESGFFNATKLCGLVRQNYGTYGRSERCGRLNAQLRPKFGDRLSLTSKQLQLERTSSVRGRYVHPLKLLDTAWWLSEALAELDERDAQPEEPYVKCAVAANAFFARTPQRRRLLEATLRVDADDSRDDLVDARLRVRTIRCAGGDELLLDDERGLINASKLCAAERPFAQFDRGAPLFGLLGRYFDEPHHLRGPIGSTEPTHGAYVHPIAAIGVLLWRGPEAYARLAGVIFARMCAAAARSAAEAVAGKRSLDTFSERIATVAEDSQKSDDSG